MASPHSTSRTPVYEASLLEMHRTCLALHLSFWSTDIMGVGLGSRAAHHELTQQVCQQLHPVRTKQHMGLAIQMGHGDGQPKGLEKAVMEQVFVRLGSRLRVNTCLRSQKQSSQRCDS